jgi:hypothetical protein
MQLKTVVFLAKTTGILNIGLALNQVSFQYLRIRNQA